MTLLERQSDAELIALAEQRAKQGRAPIVRLEPVGKPAHPNVHRFDRSPVVPDAAVGISWPFLLVLPWSVLISDNRKYAPALNKAGRAILLLTPDYRRCKGLMAQYAKDLMGDRMPAAEPLELVARFWVPDKRHVDTANYSKAICDALQGIVYTKDSWVHRSTWERAGITVDAPRAEITVRPLSLPTP